MESTPKASGLDKHQSGAEMAFSSEQATSPRSLGKSLGTDHQTSIEYRPLESPTRIRLVVLKRGSRNDPIDCILLHTDCSEQSYEALSYEWGRPSNIDPHISIDGYQTQIRTNLFDALVEIRLREEDRWMWIDALSINQSNTQERNHQVQMMSNIYKNAKNVIVWLGPAKHGSALAMEALIDPERLARTNTVQADRSARAFLDAKGAGSFMMNEFTALLALFQRSYWYRVWVQQEIFLARRFTIHCGDAHISGMDFDSFLAETLNGTLELIPKNVWDGVSIPGGTFKTNMIGPFFAEVIQRSPAYHIVIMWKRREAIPVFNRLGMWLRMCIRFQLQTSEPRDLIYAMLGLSSDCQDGELLPDYNKPLLEVYLETIAFLKSTDKSTDSQWFQRSLAEKLGLSFDEELQQRISEICAATLK